jgi:hypothetical protein
MVLLLVLVLGDYVLVLGCAVLGAVCNTVPRLYVAVLLIVEKSGGPPRPHLTQLTAKRDWGSKRALKVAKCV